MGKVPVDWERANITPIFKKNKKKKWVIYRPVSFTSIPGKVIEKIHLESISKCMKDKEVHSQHRFTKGKSRLTNFTGFYREVTSLVVNGKTVHVVYLDFRQNGKVQVR